MIQSKVIFFCYAYVAGLVVAMVAPADPSMLPLLHAAVALCLGPAAAYFGWRIVKSFGTTAPERARALSRIDWFVLLIPAMVLGYTRYTASNTVLDTRLGEVRVVQGEAVFQQDAPIADTSRLRLRKTGPLEADLRLRLHGELRARVPVLDENGQAAMDAKGRWRFRVARLEQASEIVTIRADDPAGTDYPVAEPFNRITSAEVLSGPDSAAVSLYRVSNHIGSFARPGRNMPPVLVLGHISQDPWVYDFKTVLHVEPEFIQVPPGGPCYKVEGGEIQVVLKPGLTGYERYARTEAYGYDVQARGELSVARHEANPGGFDAQRFMQNYNTFGIMSVFQPRGGSPPIRIVTPPDGTPRRGNGLVEFSLALRDQLLRVIKLTMPYPQSSFLGGVTLGLRYGLHGVVCMFSDRYRAPGPGAAAAEAVHRDCEETIADEFKESGVNHVLAVSGLHVTIITVMFIGIFALLRMPKQVYTPAIILALVVFAIITGARPSVLRAVIMNSLFLLAWAYLDQGLRASALLGVPVAAFLILLQNPLVVVDPSFTLSFGAILSLALITGPSYQILCGMRGNLFLAFIVTATATTLIGIFHWPLLVSGSFLVPYAFACVSVFWAARLLERRGIRLLGDIGYGDIPASAGAFFAAQFAIQIGMMVPLSSFYFCRWPFAGAYANLIAIPLIGVVVQLAAIGGLLGIVPVVGNYIALVLGAANWIFASAFLWLAHASALAFPYPFVRKPSVAFLIVYYLYCAGFVWHKPIWAWVKGRCERMGFAGRGAPAVAVAVLAVLCTFPLWFPHGPARKPGLNVTVLSVGYGSSLLIETPGGRNILVDTGYVEHERGRRNEAVRDILPFLSYRGIRRLDGLIITSPLPERAAGAGHILEQCWIGELCVPPGLADLRPDLPLADLLGRWGPKEALGGYPASRLQAMYDELVGSPSWPRRASLARGLRTRGDTFWNRWAGWVVLPREVKAGDVLFEEAGGERPFRIEVLGPDGARHADHPIENGSLVLRVVYGGFALLLPSDLHYEGQRRLAGLPAGREMGAQVMMVPDHGAAVPGGPPDRFKADVQEALGASLGALLDRVKPEKVILEYGNPKPVLGPSSESAARTEELTAQYLAGRLGAEACLSTDRDMAVFIHSDGEAFTVTTQAEINRAEGGIAEAVEDIEVGL